MKVKWCSPPQIGSIYTIRVSPLRLTVVTDALNSCQRGYSDEQCRAVATVVDESALWGVREIAAKKHN